MKRQSLWSKSRRFEELQSVVKTFDFQENNSLCSFGFQKGLGPPAREPLVTNEQQKEMMMHYYRRQEELKVRTSQVNDMFNVAVPIFSSFQKLEEANDDRYLDSEWADRRALKRQFQGLTNIKWGPR